MEKFKSKVAMPNEVEYILNSLYDHGYEAFIVGGCVRDSLIHKIPTDWDITTNATPEKVKEIFEKKNFRVIETGIKHGTITVIINLSNYEITTYRIESEYKDNRRPSAVCFTGALEEDLKRRDFTINALAYNNREGLIDLHGGIRDLRNKIIRTVGEADKRFEEDALRMLRAIRFSTVLEFQLDPSVNKSILKNYSHIKNISIERIRDEFIKIILADSPSEGISKLCDLKLIQYIIPELVLENKICEEHYFKYNDLMNQLNSILDIVDCNIYLRLSALLYNINNFIFISNIYKYRNTLHEEQLNSGIIASKILKRLKFDNFTVNKVNTLITYHNFNVNINLKEEIKRFIIKVGKENLEDLFNLRLAIDYKNKDTHNKIIEFKKNCNEILNNREPLFISDLAIDGSDLLEIGLKPGKHIGELLKFLLIQVLKDPKLNKRDILLVLSKKYCKY